MKRYFFLIPLMCFLVAMPWAGCKKTAPPTVKWGKDAVIVRWNYGYCPVCGGFYMNLGNSTRFDSNSLYVLSWSPSVSTFFSQNKNRNYFKVPLFVKVLYKQDTGVGPGTWLFVDSIALR